MATLPSKTCSWAKNSIRYLSPFQVWRRADLRTTRNSRKVKCPSKRAVSAFLPCLSNSIDRDYKAAVKVLQETTNRWNQEWKHACDKFQDLEEERIDFLKSNLWTYANIMSTVCVSDDETCEKIRVNLEKCEVDEVIQAFVQTKGTGQEIPGMSPLSVISLLVFLAASTYL